jgi:predicted glutamine amidotransferase
MVGFLEHKHKQAMRDLLFLNTLRGKDSTGISAISREKGVLTRKMTIPGYEFIEYPAVDKAMKHGDQLWMGHGRFKTYGDVTRANAHPFEVLDDEGYVMMVGTHNGTLNNKWDLERKLKGERFDTDSEALFNWLVEAKDFKTGINELRGAWSLVFWDPTTDSLHFCRNKERPLVFAYTKDHKVLIYASEPWMILAACGRNNVELDKNDSGLSCYSTLPDHLYTIKIPQDRDKALPDFEKEGGYVGAAEATFRKFKNWWDDDPNLDEEGKKKAKAAHEKRKANEQEDKKVVYLGQPPKVGDKVRGFNNTLISREEYDQLRAKGCSWCKDALEPGTVVAHINEDSLVCVRCMRDTHPKTDGDCVRRWEDDELDDPIPFDLTIFGKDVPQGASDEHKRLMQAAAGSAKETLG